MRRERAACTRMKGNVSCGPDPLFARSSEMVPCVTSEARAAVGLRSQRRLRKFPAMGRWFVQRQSRTCQMKPEVPRTSSQRCDEVVASSLRSSHTQHLAQATPRKTTKTSKAWKNPNAENKKTIQFSLWAWSDVKHGKQVVAGQAGKPDGQ